MKINNPFAATILALAGIAIAASPATAATPAYADGNLFLGFRAIANTGATNTYLVNIGMASLYRDATAPFTLNIGNIDADLDATFGTDWATRSEVRWGVFGGYADDGFGNFNVLFASKPEATIGVPPSAWIRRSEANQGLTFGKVSNLASGYLSGSTTTNSPSNGVIQNTSSFNDWSEFQPGGSQSTMSTSFGAYAPTIEGDFGNGAAGTRLDLFQLQPAVGGAGTNEGYFTITSSGGVSFVAAVPEPTSLAMLAVTGFGMLGFTRRRQPKSA